MEFWFSFAGSRFRVGLLALPLCGAAGTFFAAAKKVTKETACPSLSTSYRPRHRRLAEWPGSSECPHKRNGAWIAHGLTHRTTQQIGSAKTTPARFAADGSIGFACASAFLRFSFFVGFPRIPNGSA